MSPLIPAYRSHSTTFVRGAAARLWDEDEKEYIDFLSGVSVCNLGHCPPQINSVLQKQSQLLWHSSNAFLVEGQQKFAQKLVKNSFAGEVFFCNSGAEANESALKYARKFHLKNPQKREVVSFTQSYHGRTLWTLATTGQDKFHTPFQPLPSGNQYLPFNDLDALEHINQNTACVIIEPIQGEGGIYPATKDFLNMLRKKCDQTGAILIFDEIQTGAGRTGNLWAFQSSNIRPDILTFAKGMGNGFPLGGMIVHESKLGAFEPGDHGSTFGGNPLAMSVGIAVLEELLDPRLIQHVRETGAYFEQELQYLQNKFPEVITDIRGQGLMLAFTGNFYGQALIQDALKNGFVLNSPQIGIIRLLPPLIITRNEIDQLIKYLTYYFSFLQ